MSKRLGFSVLVCLLAASSSLGLAACGGGGESDEEKIETTIVSAVKGKDPAACTELMSQTVVEQTAASKGRKGVEECEESKREGSEVRSLRVANVVVEDETATAEVSFVGGRFDGQTVTMDLAEEDGQWKVQEMTGFVDFDADHLAATYKEFLFIPEKQDIPEELEAECIVDSLEEGSDAELEEMMLSPDSDAIEEMLSLCAY